MFVQGAEGLVEANILCQVGQQPEVMATKRDQPNEAEENEANWGRQNQTKSALVTCLVFVEHVFVFADGPRVWRSHVFFISD